MAERRKARRDQDLRDAVSLLPSARAEFKKPFVVPTQQEDLTVLGEELVQWSEQDDSTNIDQFFTKKRLSPMSAYKVANENPLFQGYIDLALANIGNRIEDKIKDNHLYLMNKMKHYSSLHREEARLKREADQEQRVNVTYVEEKVQIPVFTNKKDIE